MAPFNGDEFTKAMHDSGAFTYMETYRASRSDNDASYDETELARFKSATMVNDCFIRRQIKEYTMLEDALTNDLPQLTFRGFLTDVRLGPFLRGGRIPTPQKFIQSITVTGLDDPHFAQAVASAQNISLFLQQSAYNVHAPSVSPTFAGKYPTITASARLLTPAHHNRVNTENGASGRLFSLVPLPDYIDPNSAVREAIASGLSEFTEDNYVQLKKLLHTSDDTAYTFVPAFSPQEFSVGDLVEVTVSFKVGPFSKDGRKVMWHLDRVLRLSVEGSSRLASINQQREQENEVTDVEPTNYGKAPKRRIMVDDRAGVSFKLARMDLS